jgi:hypothetical protein
MAETQPRLQRAFLSLSAIISQYFTNPKTLHKRRKVSRDERRTEFQRGLRAGLSRKFDRMGAVDGAVRNGRSRYHCGPPLHPRINAMRRTVATTDTTKEPNQPRRLEKNANTAEQLLD